MVNNFLEWKTNSARGESIYPRLCLFLFFPVDLLLSSAGPGNGNSFQLTFNIHFCISSFVGKTHASPLRSGYMYI